jgi:hypothetical protein
MREAFQRNTFMFWRSISLLDEIASRLLKEEGLSAADAELVRQKHKELAQLSATVSKLHAKGEGPFPSKPPGVAYEGAARLMSIAGVLVALGMQFENTRALYKKEFGQRQTRRARDARGRRRAATIRAIIKVRGKGPSEKPYKEGSIIRDAVNSLLKQADIKEASDDYIGKELAKFPPAVSPRKKFSAD